jgi:phospholipid/cholesterol/gamma-HCH transport system permease protein
LNISLQSIPEEAINRAESRQSFRGQVDMSSTPAIAPSVPARPNPVVSTLEWFGELGIFVWQVLRAAVTPPFQWNELARQLDEIGAKSIPLVALAGAATGVVLALEARYGLVNFGAKALLPSAIVFAVVTEMSPIVTGLVVSGRVGAGIGAELAAMKVTEQIDAIEASAVDPRKLLAATRIVACIIALPLLTLAASFCGVLMGWIASTLVEPISLVRFVNAGFKGAGFKDILPPTFKTCVYGMIIGTVACFQGMRAKGGAEGVGSSATTSVVLSSLFVILADVILVKVILLIFP